MLVTKSGTGMGSSDPQCIVNITRQVYNLFQDLWKEFLVFSQRVLKICFGTRMAVPLPHTGKPFRVRIVELALASQKNVFKISNLT